MLGAILIDNEAYADAATLVDASSFFRDAHRRIYQCLAGVLDRGDKVDLLILANELKRGDLLEEVGGPGYIASLVDGVPKSTNVGYYASIVRAKAELRAVIAEAGRILSAAYEDDESAARIVETGTGRLIGCLDRRRARLVSVDDAVLEYAKSTDDEPVERVLSGFTDLDAYVGGFRAGNLIIVAARPGVGKTAWALTVADQITGTGRPVVVFSLEMMQAEVAARVLAGRSGVPTRKLEDKTATSEEWARVASALAAPRRPLLMECDSTTAAEMRAWCLRAEAQHGKLAAVFVDYLQLMAPAESRDSRQDEVAGISRSLSRLSKELKVPVVALSQLSRAPEARRDKRPQLSDLRESGALEQDCHVALLLYREEMHKPESENQGVAEVIIAKNRNGPTGVVKLAFRKELAQFANLAGDW